MAEEEGVMAVEEEEVAEVRFWRDKLVLRFYGHSELTRFSPCPLPFTSPILGRWRAEHD